MAGTFWFVVGCGVLALVYGAYAIRTILAADAGTERMQEIAAAVQEGAAAYLNRQYGTIAAVGIVVGLLLGWALGIYAAIGYFVGAILSGATGYIGMNVSVRANVRTAECARAGGLAPAHDLACKNGARSV